VDTLNRLLSTPWLYRLGGTLILSADFLKGFFKVGDPSKGEVEGRLTAEQGRSSSKVPQPNTGVGTFMLHSLRSIEYLSQKPLTMVPHFGKDAVGLIAAAENKCSRR